MWPIVTFDTISRGAGWRETCAGISPARISCAAIATANATSSRRLSESPKNAPSHPRGVGPVVRFDASLLEPIVGRIVAVLELPFLVEIEALIRTIPDFPIPGILFRDITPLLKDSQGFRRAIDLFVDRFKDRGIAYVVGVEARGYIFGAPLAYAIGAGFIPIRKPGKLPHDTLTEQYALEYGASSLEIHADSLAHGERVVVVDDVLATGGTAGATRRLLERLGATIEAFAFLVELPTLNGRAALQGIDVVTFVTY